MGVIVKFTDYCFVTTLLCWSLGWRKRASMGPCCHNKPKDVVSSPFHTFYQGKSWTLPFVFPREDDKPQIKQWGAAFLILTNSNTLSAQWNSRLTLGFTVHRFPLAKENMYPLAQVRMSCTGSRHEHNHKVGKTGIIFDQTNSEIHLAFLISMFQADSYWTVRKLALLPLNECKFTSDIKWITQ